MPVITSYFSDEKLINESVDPNSATLENFYLVVSDFHDNNFSALGFKSICEVESYISSRMLCSLNDRIYVVKCTNSQAKRLHIFANCEEI